MHGSGRVKKDLAKSGIADVEDVILSKAPFGSSARNCLPGTVTGSVSSESTVRGSLDAGFPLTAPLTSKSCRDLDLKEGSRVYAMFKATAGHVIPMNGDGRPE